MKLRPLLALGACLLVSAQALSAPGDLASPFHPALQDAAIDGLASRVPPERVDELARRSRADLGALLLPDGRVVDLELERIDVERLKLAFEVDGAPRPQLLDGLSLSLWRGTVRGESGSEVMLSFSRAGTRGWIQSGGEMVHVMPRPSESGSWADSSAWFVTESALNRAGVAFEAPCSVMAPPGAPASASGPRTPLSSGRAHPAGGQSQLGAGCGLRECRISITSDYQLFQKFSDLAAETAYVTTMLGFISDRYEQQIGVIFTFPYVAFYTTAADPWIAQDTGGDCVAVLYELQGAWAGAVPNGGDIGHLLSGANLGCGVAWLNVLCAPPFNFSVSGNINGIASFPIVQQPNNWDYIVTAHEIGHNFNAIHTHDYCPPADECPPTQYFGACQTQQVCSSSGTLMSYCHLCTGGTANITGDFHPWSINDMNLAAVACLPMHEAIRGTRPSLVATNTPVAVTADVAGTPSGPVQVLWRPNAAAAFQPIAMTLQTPCVYAATLPGFACNDAPRFYYSFVNSIGVTLTDPPGAPATTYALDVGTTTTVQADDFEVDLGWIATVVGATAGQWERGIPVDDAGWAYDPAADGDGSGRCWLTQNAPGNTDVDGGAVQLTSPVLDLSSPSSALEYEYFLKLTISNGFDKLLVEASVNGAAGPWVEIARHFTDGDLAWRHHAIDHATMVSAGITPSASTLVRFTANDGDPSSIVEAGLDGVRIIRRSCTGIGANFCATTANSAGAPATITATGTISVVAHDLVLRAAPVPASSIGAFYCGPTATQVAFGNGARCATGAGFFFGARPAAGGALAQAVDATLPPAAGQLVAGSTWHFQAWFRDVAAGGANFNLSDGYRVTFAP